MYVYMCVCIYIYIYLYIYIYIYIYAVSLEAAVPSVRATRSSSRLLGGDTKYSSSGN